MQFLKTRSQFVTSLLAYLWATKEELSRNPLLERVERKLDELRVPLRVVPHEPIRDLEEVRAREHFRKTNSGDRGDELSYGADKSGRRAAYAFRGAQLAQESESRQRPEPLSALEPKLEMAVLLGDPGSGKTEWLKYFARLAASKAHQDLEDFAIRLEDLCFPAWVRLPDVAAELKDERALLHLLSETGCVPTLKASLVDAERAAAAILSVLIKHHQLSKRLAPWVWERMFAPRYSGKNAPMLLCLDAWDEVRSEQKSLARDLNAFASATTARIFLTSRIIGYSDKPLPVSNSGHGPRRELRICPFERNETETFVTDFFRATPGCGQAMLAELRSKVTISGMAQNPLLSTLLCLAFSPQADKPPLEFPARRVEVYQRVLEGLLGVWEAMRNNRKPNWDLINAKLRLLEAMAYQFFPDEELSGERLHDFLWNETSGYMNRLADGHPLKQMLRQNPSTNIITALMEDAVLVPFGAADASSFLFLHLTFQEYLTACEFARREDAISIALMHLYEPAWEEVLQLLGGALNEQGRIYLATLLRANEEDLLCRPLKLFALASTEAHLEVVLKRNAKRWNKLLLDIYASFPSENPYLVLYLMPLFNDLDFISRENVHDTANLAWSRPYGATPNWRGISAKMKALGKIESPEITLYLLPLLRDIYVGSAVELALGRIGGAQEIISREEKKLGLDGSSTLGGAQGVISRSPLLRNPDWQVREATVVALGNIGIPEIIQHLVPILNDSVGQVQLAARKALGKVRMAIPPRNAPRSTRAAASQLNRKIKALAAFLE